MNSRFQNFKLPHEVLDVIIDEWCDHERQVRHVPTTKLELKNELGRSVGLGNGDENNTPAKGIYRYCSGETPLSLDKALAICRYMQNFELIQWMGYQAGMVMTPRAVIEELEGLDAADIFDQIVECLTDTTQFIETLSRTYQSKPCFELITKIEGVFFKATLQMERCRLMFRKLIEKMMKPGAQGELWFGFDSLKKTRKGRKNGRKETA